MEHLKIIGVNSHAGRELTRQDFSSFKAYRWSLSSASGYCILQDTLEVHKTPPESLSV